jgi:hypothetical protein
MRFLTHPRAKLLVAIGAALVAGAAGVPAHAAPGVKYGIHDDAWLRDGPGSLEQRLSTLNSLGVELVRYNLRWNVIAAKRPAAATDDEDAAYHWEADDAIVSGLRAHGIGVVLGFVGTPRWANGGRGPNYAPNSASSTGSFATAAAVHYPWVKRWLVWNEPNQRRWLLPTRPNVYVARLLNPAYTALHRQIPGVQVGGGVTAPRGVTNGVSPVAWIRGMRAAHARVDAYAHNPYPLSPKIESPLAGGCGHCLTITMSTMRRLVTEVTRAFGPRTRIWLTEYGYQTNPPDRLLGVSRALQARYLAEGALQAYRTARVDMLIQFLFRDEPNLERFQSGLVQLNGVKKPSFAAFQLPLAQVARTGARVRLWGQLRAPAAATDSYRLQRRVGTAWRNVTTPRPARRRAYFVFTGALPAGTLVRVVSGSVTSPPLLVR